MKIAITGSTGLVGSALVEHFQKSGHSITRIVRPESTIQDSDTTLAWDVESKNIETDKLEGHDVVINLSGANIAAQRWSPEYKKIIYSSRVDGTKFLCDTLSKLSKRPKLLFSASAVGFYGILDAEKEVDEYSIFGNDFLAKTCIDWEEATKPAEFAGIGVIHMRLGAVVSPRGGALAKMLPIFKLGLGGPLGSGKQIFSWIAVDEIPFIIEHLIDAKEMTGPVNLVSPEPVSNREFTKILGNVLQRPAFFPVPAFGVKFLFGEMAEALLLNGAKIIPKKLNESGYAFQYPLIEEVLKSCLNG